MSSPVAPVAHITPTIVWRDALGPGYANGVVESVVKVAGEAARRPYHACRR